MLSGIRIIDFSSYLPGPYATQRLSDLGAEVIKVEPLNGDPARTLGSKKDGNGLIFLANNRNKKSISINLKDRLGKQIALELIAKSDVVLESFRPRVMGKLGLDYETIKKMNPKLIYCSISGYGQHTTLSSMGSHDLNYMALSGVLSQMKDTSGKPIHPTTTFADLIGGQAASEAILAALYQRERTKEGCYLDLALADSIADMMTNHVFIQQVTSENNGLAELNGNLVCYSLYETSDGKFISLAALEQKFWKSFCIAVGKEMWISAQFSHKEEKNEVYQELRSLFLSKTRDEWEQFGSRIDCCLTPVLETNELTQHSYFHERKKVSTSKVGFYKMNGITYFDHEETYPPQLGENTNEILMEILNYTPQQVDLLKKNSVINKNN